jgi:ribonuclease-3
LFLFRNYTPHQKNIHQFLRKQFSLKTHNISIYEKAFIHKSTLREQESKNTASNERLEFLGDAILDSIVAEHLFLIFPKHDEGLLTRIKARIVNRDTLNYLADKIKIAPLIKFQHFGSNNPKSLLADCLEALIGAIYLDKGYVRTKNIVLKKILLPNIDLNELQNNHTDYKTKIIIWAQREKKQYSFTLLQEQKIDHQIQYTVSLEIDGISVSVGKAFSKKDAEQIAAEAACKKINV